MLSRIALDSQDSYPFFSGYPFFLVAIRFLAAIRFFSQLSVFFSNLVKFPISSHFFAFSQFFHLGTTKTMYEPYFHSVFPTSMLTIHLFLLQLFGLRTLTLKVRYLSYIPRYPRPHPHRIFTWALPDHAVSVPEIISTRFVCKRL